MTFENKVTQYIMVWAVLDLYKIAVKVYWSKIEMLSYKQVDVNKIILTEMRLKLFYTCCKSFGVLINCYFCLDFTYGNKSKEVHNQIEKFQH